MDHFKKSCVPRTNRTEPEMEKKIYRWGGLRVNIWIIDSAMFSSTRLFECLYCCVSDVQ